MSSVMNLRRSAQVAIISVTLVLPFQAAASPVVAIDCNFNTSAQVQIVSLDPIQPKFYLASTGSNVKMDKVGTIAKSGQALWDKPSMTNGGNNMFVAAIRARRKVARDAGLKALKSVPV